LLSSHFVRGVTDGISVLITRMFSKFLLFYKCGLCLR